MESQANSEIPTSADKTSGEITQILNDWHAGSPQAMEELVRLVYGDLRAMARSYQRGEKRGGVQSTELVHELIQQLMEKPPQFNNRLHFFRTARMIMRQILIQMARAGAAQKRNAGKQAATFNEELVNPAGLPTDPAVILSLTRALEQLGELDDRKRQIVELRYFMGQTVEEISDLLDISPRTVAREWDFAKKWLAREMKRDENPPT